MQEQQRQRKVQKVIDQNNLQSSTTSEELADTFSVLSDPTRIEMLRLLVSNQEVACTTFDVKFPISKSTISYHVKALRHAGLIRVRKEGKFYYYTLLRDYIERRLPGLLALIRSPSNQSNQVSPASLVEASSTTADLRR